MEKKNWIAKLFLLQQNKSEESYLRLKTIIFTV